MALRVWRRGTAGLFLVLAMVVLVLSRSQTALVMAVLGLVGLLAAIGFSRAGRMKGFYGALLLAALILCMAQATGIVTFVTELVGRDATFSGRTNIWRSVWPFIELKPALGWGFGAVWSPKDSVYVAILGSTGLSIPNAHSGYLDVLLQVGAVGLMLQLLPIGFILAKSLTGLRRGGDRLFAWSTVLVTMLLVMNMTDERLSRPICALWLGALFALVARAPLPVGQVRPRRGSALTVTS